MVIRCGWSGRSNGQYGQGGEWTNKLYFTDDAENPGESPVEISDDEVETYFAEVEGTEENIVDARIYKNNLFTSWLPKLGGMWHEFTVVESKSWYWSFEKNAEGIQVQRGKTLKSVRDSFRGEARVGSVEPEGRPPTKGHKGDTIQHIFVWIYKKDELNKDYHVTKSNCHFLASMVFEAIARLKGRKLQ
ncbi:unnamed protein product [Oppiella nova]|uniref:Uncharacterized protein n=1 Tax=Oppiella nova TaxID=334625 RepID=A0A7R9M1T1_9ACAR|nr:unnamed protein product [Oppiella nova]CAG2168442.1 unnamed protein product [Oppiella nova]